MKKVWMILGAVVVVALIAAGSFWGGMADQTNRATQAQANFLNARGQGGTGQFANGGQAFPGVAAPIGQAPGNFGGRGTAGQVKTVEGNILTLSTAQDVTTVNLSDSTQIQKTVSGSVSDLQPGTQVMVTGQKDSKGVINATQIRIMTNDLPSMPAPSATQAAP